MCDCNCSEDLDGKLEVAYDNGYEDGKRVGYREGHDEGYDCGYSEGEDASSYHDNVREGYLNCLSDLEEGEAELFESMGDIEAVEFALGCMKVFAKRYNVSNSVYFKDLLIPELEEIFGVNIQK